MVRPNDQLSIGEVSARSGHAQSALRHYETLGLIASVRTAGNQRRFRRSVLRRLAVIKAAQRVGLTLTDVARSFAGIDPHGAPNRGQWRRISAEWQPLVDQRIAEMEQVRDNLANCVGCGCLSMKQCNLYNPQDSLSNTGTGARRLFPVD